MTYVPGPGVVELDLQGSYDGERVELTFYVHVTVPITETLLNLLAGVVLDWWDSDLQPGVSNDFTVVQVKATDLTTQSSPTITLPYTGSSPTGVGTHPQPGNVTAAITKATNNRGRSFRGRNFIPGLDGTALSDVNHIQSGNLAAFLTVWGDLDSAFRSQSATPVVFSRFSNGAARTTGVATNISEYRMDNTVDSQRRRLAGRGQ